MLFKTNGLFSFGRNWFFKLELLYVFLLYFLSLITHAELFPASKFRLLFLLPKYPFSPSSIFSLF